MQNWELLCPYDFRNKRIFFFLHKNFSEPCSTFRSLYITAFLLTRPHVRESTTCAVLCCAGSLVTLEPRWCERQNKWCCYCFCWLWNCWCGSGWRGCWRSWCSRPSCATRWPRRCRWTWPGSTWWPQAVCNLIGLICLQLTEPKSPGKYNVVFC